MRTRLAAATAAALLLTACGGGGTEAPSTNETVTAEQETPTPEGGGDGSTEGSGDTPQDEAVGLSETVEYDSGVEVRLTNFVRSVSSDVASPSDTPYLRFTVVVVNSGSETMDLSEMLIGCMYGETGREGEQIFDEGLDFPTTHLRPGRSANVTAGCELPEEETYAQIEVAPDFESDTAIFAGHVE
ncbi:hypothetical protein [Streptomyces barkulensis]|uniref:hypothetical protein n=1 Tax=Streptomyces barkulensis TaxID=1257026 RepID=UPI000C6E8C9F|nr:hypothetical protein [Streptomyces barkulensis]